MTILTRFAPSPTGYLHIGGARTALFNYLFAKKHGGKFLLRIEDTDKARSTPEAVEAIINGLNFLGISYQEPAIYQSKQLNRHIKIAELLVKNNLAYYCYCPKAELEAKRLEAEKAGKIYLYEGKCRDLAQKTNNHSSVAIRLRVDKSGSTTINDLVMGNITVANSTIDDLVLLRSDKTPTYMLAVVVDDFDMKITHVIRGDDHLTNTFRQIQIYKNLGWKIPVFAHLPLILGHDGTKLSKRHGATALEDYQALGFLPIALRNYLLRLGWSHQNDEIISDAQAIEWFDMKNVNKSSARFDIIKLTNINWHYIKTTSNQDLLTNLETTITQKFSVAEINPKYKDYLLQGLTSIKGRSKTLIELLANSLFYILKPPFILDVSAKNLLANNLQLIKEQIQLLEKHTNFTREALHLLIKEHALTKNLKLGPAVEALRVSLTGKIISPSSVFEIMEVLQKDESLKRINLSLK